MAFAAEQIFAHARTMPDKTAVAADGREVTFSRLAALVYGVAEALKEQGLPAESRVVSVASATVDYVAVCYGIHLGGYVHVPVEKGIPRERLAEIADRVEAALILSPEDPARNGGWYTPSELMAAGGFRGFESLPRCRW